MPEDTENAKMAGTLPNMNVKEGAMIANNMKVVNRPLVPLNRVQANLKDGDLQKLANAITMEVN